MPVQNLNEYLGLSGYTQTTTNSLGAETTLTGPSTYRRTWTYSRTYVKRPKPLTEYIKPTEYVLAVDESVQEPSTMSSRSLVPGDKSAYNRTGQLATVYGGQNTSMPSASLQQRNKVIIDALLKLKDQRINLAQAYAERKMTADLVANSLNRIANSVLALRRGNWRQAGKWLKQNWKKAPGSWLEYQYGWNPLMSDVFGACEALKKQPLEQWLVSVKSSAKDITRTTSVAGAFNGTTPSPHERVVQFTEGHFIRLDYEPGNTFMSTVSSLGLTNPLQLAWELVPYSFVIDWFLPIGDWLSAMDAATGFKFYAGSITNRREQYEWHDNLRYRVGISSNQPWSYANGRYRAYRRQFALKREVFGSSPLPSTPYFKTPFSTLHVANGMALLTQALKPGPVRVR